MRTYISWEELGCALLRGMVGAAVIVGAVLCVSLGPTPDVTRERLGDYVDENVSVLTMIVVMLAASSIDFLWRILEWDWLRRVRSAVLETALSIALVVLSMLVLADDPLNYRISWYTVLLLVATAALYRHPLPGRPVRRVIALGVFVLVAGGQMVAVRRFVQPAIAKANLLFAEAKLIEAETRRIKALTKPTLDKGRAP